MNSSITPASYCIKIPHGSNHGSGTSLFACTDEIVKKPKISIFVANLEDGSVRPFNKRLDDVALTATVLMLLPTILNKDAKTPQHQRAQQRPIHMPQLAEKQGNKNRENYHHEQGNQKPDKNTLFFLKKAFDNQSTKQCSNKARNHPIHQPISRNRNKHI